MTDRDERGRFEPGHELAGPGRPPTYGEAEREEILLRLVAGEPLVEICRDAHLPDQRTVHLWIVTDPDFAERHEMARRAQSWGYADQFIPLSRRGRGKDMAGVQQTKNEIDTLKWWLARVLRTDFGDNLSVAHAHAHYGAVKVSIELPDNGRLQTDDADLINGSTEQLETDTVSVGPTQKYR